MNSKVWGLMKNRFVWLGILILLLVIPLYFVSQVVSGRERYADDAADAVARTRGGKQTVSNMMLFVPIVEPTTTVDDAGVSNTRMVRKMTSSISVSSDVNIALNTSTVRKGIFDVPIYEAHYQSTTQISDRFLQSYIEKNPKSKPLWDEAYLAIRMTDLTTLKGRPSLSQGDQNFDLRPFDGNMIVADIGDPRGRTEPFKMDLNFSGSGAIELQVMGQQSQYHVKSDWPHPILKGDFASSSYSSTDAGFEVSYSIPFLATGVDALAVSREWKKPNLHHGSRISIELIDAVGFYQKAVRLAKYSILFIALSFVIALAMERAGATISVVQFAFIALAQMLFPVLMVAYAEQIGFLAAYVLSSTATIALISIYAFSVLGFGRNAIGLGGGLSVLFAVDYFIVSSMDYALIAGSTLAFVGLAVAMFVTRNTENSTT